MSDLRTELFTKVVPKMSQLTNQTLDNLTFDDPDQPDVPAQEAEITNNERIFNWVKAHPACYSKDVAKGFDGVISSSSVMSQLFNLTERGVLHKTVCSSTGSMIYSAAVDSYPRSSKAKRVQQMFDARNKLPAGELARRISEGHKRKKAEAATSTLAKKIVLVKKPEQPATPAVQVTPVDLNTLSIVQARKLYDELKQIFGA